MSEPKADLNVMHHFLHEPLRVGEPDVAGALAVFPVFGPEPRQTYIAFATGRERGVKILERKEGASINKLAIENPTDVPVLLYEGEEVVGARQNRIFSVSVLVPAVSKLDLPVSCVEAGRWDPSRHLDEFVPSPHSAYPELRKWLSSGTIRRLQEAQDAFREARRVQQGVWASVSSKSERHGTRSPTSAMHDVYEGRREALARMQAAISLRPGQSGMIAAIGGRFVVLDYVSRPDVFAELQEPLLHGYALDAFEAEESEPPEIEAARGFALLVADCAVARRSPSLGLGDEIRIASNGVTGSALVVDGELVQLTAFPGDEPGHDRASARRARIARPRHRR
jgi:hypothetical protein